MLLHVTSFVFSFRKRIKRIGSMFNNLEIIPHYLIIYYSVFHFLRRIQKPKTLLLQIEKTGK